MRAKPGVEGWYLDYLLADYDNYIVPTQFCEEARVGFSTSFTDGLGNALTPYNEYTPTFKCATDANGKGILANEPKIGLITYDEVVFAGGYYKVANSSYYLHYVNSFSTMSTAGYSTSANYWYIGANGSIKYGLSNFSVNIRPVISIKSDFEVTGIGTRSNPYVIEF